ncbi:MAG TPA: hypothetical protein VFC79_11795, partial [Tissierellaceae bacterium]|nr:hypothetical protein [Tissierellaceae bacterium]
IEEDEVTFQLEGGDYSRREQTGGTYTPEDTKWVEDQLDSWYDKDGYTGTLDEYEKRIDVPADSFVAYKYVWYSDAIWKQCQVDPANCQVPNSVYYNKDGYTGTLTLDGRSGNDAVYSGLVTSEAYHYFRTRYRGYVTRPEVDTRTWDYYYSYYVWVTYYEKGVSFRIGINGAAKKSIRGWVRVNDEAIEVREVDSKINGVLRGQSFDI